jgi:hypothetical protein
MPTKIDKNRRIVCAANKCDEFLILGARHWDHIMRRHYDLLELRLEMPAHEKFEQGFLNTWGEFLNRKDAWIVACHNEQILQYVGNQSEFDLGVYGAELFSENLY